MISLLLTTLLLLGPSAGSYSIQLQSTITGLTVSNEAVYIITSSGTVYNFSSPSTLVSYKTHNLGVNMNNLALDDKDGGNLIVCFVNTTCIKIVNGDIVNSSTSYYSEIITYSSSSIVYTNGIVYVGGWPLPINPYGMLLRKINFNTVSVNSVDQVYQVSFNSMFSPRFVSSFTSQDGFVYFLIQDRKEVRILRVCREGSLKALYEVHLKSLPVTTSSQLVAGQLVTVGTVATVMVGLSFEGNISGVYGIRLSNINAMAADSYSDCYNGAGKVKLPWETPSFHESCGQFGPQTGVSQCNFKSLSSNINALHSKYDDSVQNVVELNGRLTASKFLVYHSHLLYYAALVNTTSSFINKYLLNVTNNGIIVSSQLLKAYSVNGSVYNIDSSLQHDRLIVTTATTVLSMALDDCSTHTNCSQCVSSADLFCGWCVIENRCSIQGRCAQSNSSGHWVQQSNQCITVDISITRVALTNATEVFIVTTPSLPPLPPNESYYCTIQNKSENISVTVQLTHNNTRCPVPLLHIKQHQSLDFNISLTTSLSKLPFAVANNQLTIVNCSKSDSCSHCLTDWGDTCEWSTSNMMCTAKHSNDTQPTFPDSEAPLALVSQVCPFIVAAVPESLPVLADNNEINIIGSNLPSPEYSQYVCTANHSTGLYQSEAVYINSTHIRCTFSSFDNFSNITESMNIQVYWSTTISLSTKYKLELYRNSSYNKQGISVLFYNCSSFSTSCTFCLESSRQLGATGCLWCNNKCSSSQECSGNMSITYTNSCPIPIINSISPKSGPVAGGTVVSIFSNQLPINFNDIISVHIGPVKCGLLSDSFISGSQVSCTTGPATSIGPHNIVLVINRDGHNVNSNTSEVFSYQEFLVRSVFPTWGPIAGGTKIRVSGSFLNIGESSRTRVEVAGIDCMNLTITYSSIDCTTQSSSSLTTGNIKVIIDGTIVSYIVPYQYRSNPVCTQLLPDSTIPSGRITLSFVGQHMTSVFEPELIIHYSNITYSTICSVVNETHIQCLAPPISSVLTVPSDPVSLNYSLKLDNIIYFDTPLYLKPNPNFTAISKITPTRITISGFNINSVSKHEIAVTVGNRSCAIEEITDQLLICIPPVVTNVQRKYSADVIVTVGNGAIVTNVGYVPYDTVSSPQTGSSSLILALVIGGATLIMSIVMLIGGAVAVKYWKIKHPPLKNLTHPVIRSSTRSSSSHVKALEISLQQSNHYYGIITDTGDNIYETIPDISSTFYQNTAPPLDIPRPRNTEYDHLNRTVPNQVKPASLPIYSNTLSAANIPRPSSAVALSSFNYDQTTSRISLSSPDLSTTSRTNSTTNLVPESERSDEMDGKLVIIGTKATEGPEYAKVIKKLTPIQEDKVYTKSSEGRPLFLKLPQEEYVSMRSASKSSPIELPTNYIQMRPSTATTPQEELMESSYVVMRSASVTSDSAPSTHATTGKRSRLASKTSIEESQASEDVFLSSTNENYITVTAND